MSIIHQTAIRLRLSVPIPDKEKVKPGETVVFKVMIKPYRKEAETVEIPYVVPKTQKEGTMAFEVKGGGFVQLAEVLQSGLVINPQEAGQMSTADRLNDLKNLNKNNEIVITPTVGYSKRAGPEQSDC